MKWFYRTLSWLVILLTPLGLLFLGLRLLGTPLYLQIEYRMPGFPVDGYGFTLDDRLQWSKVSLDYLLGDVETGYLEDLTLADGSPLFNERELKHMQDTRNIVLPVKAAGYSLWVLMAGLGLWAHFGQWMQDYRRGLRRGGWLSVILVVTIAAFAVAAFMQFFTVFHAMLFESDTWIFLYSDTLIRLFPVRFWQDCFIYVGVIVLVGGLLLGLLFKNHPKA